MSLELDITPEDVGFKPSVFHDDGDVILRSSDQINFKVHKLFLRAASPFFDSMFGLPDTLDHNVPIVEMVEDAAELDHILRWIYPIADRPVYSSIVEARSFIRIADKFELVCVLSSIRSAVLAFALHDPNPLRGWAIANIYNDEPLRRSAMQAFIVKNTPISLETVTEELDHVTALELAQLCAVRTRIHQVAQDYLCGIGWLVCSTGCRWIVTYHAMCRNQANPFSDELLSNTFLELCCASHGHAHGACVAWHLEQNRALVVKAKLALQRILDTEIPCPNLS